MLPYSVFHKSTIACGSDNSSAGIGKVKLGSPASSLTSSVPDQSPYSFSTVIGVPVTVIVAASNGEPASGVTESLVFNTLQFSSILTSCKLIVNS